MKNLTKTNYLFSILFSFCLCFSSCNNSEKSQLKALTTDFLSFISNYSYNETEELEYTRIEIIYENYKTDNTARPRFTYGYTFSLDDSSKIECLYLKDDVFEKMNHTFIQTCGVVSSDGIYKYSHLVSKESFDSNPQDDLMALQIDNDVEKVPLQIDGYTLLDIIKTYYDYNHGYSFIDTIGFSVKDSVVNLDDKTVNYENKNYFYSIGFELNNEHTFFWCWQLERLGFECCIENETKYYVGSIRYSKYNLNKDSSYYDALDNCTIDKEVIDENDDFSYCLVKIDLESFTQLVGISFE